MALEVWHPWDELREMERRMEDMLRHPLLEARRPLSWWRTPSEEVGWTPTVEMYEKGDKFVVKADLPGMKKEELDISVVGDTLTIKGERKAESEVKNEDYYRCELCYGKFSRSIALPGAVDAEKIEAKYENGVLEITLPKVEEAKPKKIEIKAK